MTQTKSLRIIHVDDDPGSIRKVKKLLSNREGIEYLGGLTSADEALEFLTKERADLVLLDVEMPDHDGLWLAEQIRSLQTKVAFVTSYAGYATQAFEVCALDYLLKPLDEDKLHILLERVRYSQAQGTVLLQEQMEAYRQYMDPKQRPVNIYLSMMNRIQVVALADVMYFSATSNYTTAMMRNGDKHLTSKTIKTYIEAMKHNTDFVRINRSNIINKAHVNSLVRDEKTRNYTLVMANGDELETIFKTKKEAIEAVMI